MKRSEELRALANRLDARAASLLFPGQPEMANDMKAAAEVVRERAAEVEAKEEALNIGNSHGPEKPAIAPSVAG